MIKAFVIEEKDKKICKSDNYNFIFDKNTGFFARWGKTKEDDPNFSPFGPEIADIEISTSSKCSGKCKFCYKGNGHEEQLNHNMTLEEFKIIFEKINKNKILTQIAFGICDINTNPYFFPIMQYARDNGVIPNYTCNGHGVTKEIAEETSKICGAVAVSLVDKEKSYNAIKMFNDCGMKQVNIHFMLSMETYDRAFEIVKDIANDNRLKGLNAIVFLQYKRKGRNRDNFHSVLDVEKYKKLINFCEENKVRYGFDSCSAPLFSDSIKERVDKEQLEMMAESCESSLFSIYLNSHGVMFPCSFTENEENWTNGIDVKNCEDFIKDVWMSKKVVEWREKLISTTKNGHRHCITFNLY